MERTQISLTVEERQALDKVAAKTGRSISSLIRDAVDRTYGSGRSVEEDLGAMRDAFGAWTRTDGDGEAFVEQVRSGSRLAT